MKKSRMVLLAVVISLIGLSGCVDLSDLTGGNDYSAEEPFSYNVSAQNQLGLRLAGITGTVTVTGSPGATAVSITGKRRVEAESYSVATECLKQLHVNVQGLGNEVVVETMQPNETHGRNYIVDYTITVPPTFSTQVTNVTGAVSVSSVNSSVVVGSVTGSITLDQINGNAKVSVVTGSIDGRVALPVNGIIDFSSVTGSISLRIPRSTSAQLSATLTTGSISTTNLVFTSQTTSQTSLSGKLADGKGTIALKTVTGAISVTGL